MRKERVQTFIDSTGRCENSAAQCLSTTRGVVVGSATSKEALFSFEHLLQI